MEDDSDVEHWKKFVATDYDGQPVELSDWQKKWIDWVWKHKDCGGTLKNQFVGRRIGYRWVCSCEKENHG